MSKLMTIVRSGAMTIVVPAQSPVPRDKRQGTANIRPLERTEREITPRALVWIFLRDTIESPGQHTVNSKFWKRWLPGEEGKLARLLERVVREGFIRRGKGGKTHITDKGMDLYEELQVEFEG